MSELKPAAPSPERAEPGGEREGAALQLVYFGYVAGAWLAQLLPEALVYGVAHGLGRLAARRARRTRAIVERNLSRVTGAPLGSAELERAVVAAFESYARYWLESFRLARAPRELFLERFVCHGVERLDAVLARGRGAVVVIGHLGNWDAAGAWCARGGCRRRLRGGRSSSPCSRGS